MGHPIPTQTGNGQKLTRGQGRFVGIVTLIAFVAAAVAGYLFVR
jgi:hypothetical protein